MRRREFITLLCGVAVAMPISAHAQKPESVRRIGVLIPFEERDPQVQALWPVFKRRLHDLGWIEGRQVHFDYRFGQSAESIRIGAGELIASSPDLIVVWSNLAVAPLRQATKTIPVVFTQVSDPVESGFVANLARPGGNITGFQNFEPAIGGKWLEILKEIAPRVRRVAFIYNEKVAANTTILRAAEAASASLGMTVTATAWIPSRAARANAASKSAVALITPAVRPQAFRGPSRHSPRSYCRRGRVHGVWLRIVPAPRSPAHV